MCGICGQIVFDPAGYVSRDAIAAMCATLAHRGPDDRGVWAEG